MGRSGGKELYGLIGYPVKHSFSGFMHNAAFAHLGINAEYELFEVSPDKLEDFFKTQVAELGLSGFNITVPHKEASVPYLYASVSPNVIMNMAVNTVRVEPDGTLSGINTDGVGFARDVKEMGFDVAGKKIALLGAGGGAKAVATALAASRPGRILIFDIDTNKSRMLCEIVKKFFKNVSVEVVVSLDALDIKSADLLINATPVGMKESDELLIKKEWLRSSLFVYDLIYNPRETKLLKIARESGCKTANGIGMLLHQGCLAFEYWTGQGAPVEVMRGALLERLSACAE